MIKEIYNVRYQMNLGCGRDSWRIYGDVNGNSIMPSVPVKFDGECFYTVSGSIYKIMSYQQDPQKFSEQIHSDIKNKGYESH